MSRFLHIIFYTTDVTSGTGTTYLINEYKTHVMYTYCLEESTRIMIHTGN
jgi:hypothetical protein